jgi:hypothetical protein
MASLIQGHRLERIISADPARGNIVIADRDAIVPRILAAATRTSDGKLRFDQPIKADILTPVTRAEI